MKRTLLLLAVTLAFVAGRGLAAADAKPNTLTEAEKTAGWKLLFDGKTLDGWKASENQGSFTVQDGELVVFGKRSHLFYTGPIANHDFKNFELSLDIIEELVAIRGIGRWTAEMFLIFHLMRPNVLPLDDVGLLRGISRNYFSGEPVSRAEAREVGDAWAPFRSVATWYIWLSLDPLPVDY